MSAVSFILRLLSVCLFFVIFCEVSAKETTTDRKEILQNIPSKYKNSSLDVVKHRMKNNLHLFSTHISSQTKQTSSTFFTTNEQGKFQWALKLRMSNNSLISCSQNEIIDTENETIFALSIPKGEQLFVNDKVINNKKETNVLLVVNKKGSVIQSIKFTSESLHPEFGLVVSQANSKNNFVCLVEKRNSLLLNTQPFGEKDGLYLLRFSKEKSTGQFTVSEKNSIGLLNDDSISKNQSLAGIQLVVSNDNQVFLHSNYPNSGVSFQTPNGYIPLFNKFFNRYFSPNDIRKNYRKVHVFIYNDKLLCKDYWYFPGSIQGIAESANSNFILLHGISYFRKNDLNMIEKKNSLVQLLNNPKQTLKRLDSVSYNMDFLRSQDNYKTSNMITYIRYVYDSQLLKHYKILRRYSDQKLEDVISMEEPYIDSKSVVSKDGKYIHCMVAIPHKSQNPAKIQFKEYTLLIKNEEMFKIEKNKVADK